MTAPFDAVVPFTPPPQGDGKAAERFFMDKCGLWKRNEGSTSLWLAAPFEVIADVRDTDNETWGRLLQFHDRDGVIHEEIIPSRHLIGDGVAAREQLAHAGLMLNAVPAARQAFIEYLNLCNPALRVRTVTHIGWHRIGGRRVFVLPQLTFGETNERVMLQAEERSPHTFHQSGTLAEWQTEIGMRLIGNSRLVFAASTALAAPLLGLLDAESCGFNLKGHSRLGKSTALRIAAGICGGTPENGANGFVRQWRATDNGMEGIATAHCDCLLPMDELGQMDPHAIGDVVYGLANGMGKLRASRTGAARRVQRWRVLLLSTGEDGIAERNAEVGKRTRAGQEVRLIDVPSDAGCGMGIFEHLHGASSAGELAEWLNAATRKTYGAPLRTFLKHLLQHLEQDEAGFLTDLHQRRNRILAAVLPADADGQVRSVAASFALVALAGERAAEAGIMPWPPADAIDAAQACLNAWLSERGTSGAREDMQAIVTLRDFLQRNGSSRFEVWHDPLSLEQSTQEQLQAPPVEHIRTINRAGWRRWQRAEDGSGCWYYYLTSDGMHEALRGLNLRAAVKLLQRHGYLQPPDKQGKTSHTVSVPGHGKTRLYCVTASIMLAGDGLV